MPGSTLTYDPTGLLQPTGPLASNALHAWKERLDEAHLAIMGRRKRREQGWMDAPHDRAMLKRVEAAATATKKYDVLLVLGIGGSDLGARAILDALPSKRRVVFAGANTDPDELEELLRDLPWKKTAVNVISKSGDTVEPMSAFQVARERLRRAVGKTFARHIIATTDPIEGSLHALAKREGYAELPVPRNVGGRFSVLTEVGLFPSAWAGVRIRDLLKGARHHVRLFEHAAYGEQPAAVWAAMHVAAYRDAGRKTWVLMPYAARLRMFAVWFRQLIAESLGKTEAIGPTPVAALGATDQHSQLQLYMDGPEDKLITFIEVEQFSSRLRVPAGSPIKGLSGRPLEDLIHAERRFTAEALAAQGRPQGTIFLPKLNAYHLGELIQMFMLATAYLGELFRIDAYDQPGVEDGKRRFHEWLKL